MSSNTAESTSVPAGPADPSDFDYVVEPVPEVTQSYSGVIEEMLSQEEFRKVESRFEQISGNERERVEKEFIDWFRESDDYSEQQAKQVEMAVNGSFSGEDFTATDVQGYHTIPSSEVSYDGDIALIDASEDEILEFQANMEASENFEFGHSEDFPGYTGQRSVLEIYEAGNAELAINYDSREIEIDSGAPEDMKKVAEAVNEVFQVSKSDYSSIKQSGSEEYSGKAVIGM